MKEIQQQRRENEAKKHNEKEREGKRER